MFNFMDHNNLRLKCPTLDGFNYSVNVYICYITLSQIFQVLYNYETIKVHPDTLPDS